MKVFNFYMKQSWPKTANELSTLCLFHFIPAVLIVPREEYILRIFCLYYALF